MVLTLSMKLFIGQREIESGPFDLKKIKSTLINFNYNVALENSRQSSSFPTPQCPIYLEGAGHSFIPELLPYNCYLFARSHKANSAQATNRFSYLDPVNACRFIGSGIKSDSSTAD